MLHQVERLEEQRHNRLLCSFERDAKSCVKVIQALIFSALAETAENEKLIPRGGFGAI